MSTVSINQTAVLTENSIKVKTSVREWNSYGMIACLHVKNDGLLAKIQYAALVPLGVIADIFRAIGYVLQLPKCNGIPFWRSHSIQKLGPELQSSAVSEKEKATLVSQAREAFAGAMQSTQKINVGFENTATLIYNQKVIRAVDLLSRLAAKLPVQDTLNFIEDLKASARTMAANESLALPDGRFVNLEKALLIGVRVNDVQGKENVWMRGFLSEAKSQHVGQVIKAKATEELTRTLAISPNSVENFKHAIDQLANDGLIAKNEAQKPLAGDIGQGVANAFRSAIPEVVRQADPTQSDAVLANLEMRVAALKEVGLPNVDVKGAVANFAVEREEARQAAERQKIEQEHAKELARAEAERAQREQTRSAAQSELAHLTGMEQNLLTLQSLQKQAADDAKNADLLVAQVKAKREEMFNMRQPQPVEINYAIGPDKISQERAELMEQTSKQVRHHMSEWNQKISQFDQELAAMEGQLTDAMTKEKESSNSVQVFVREHQMSGDTTALAVVQSRKTELEAILKDPDAAKTFVVDSAAACSWLKPAIGIGLAAVITASAGLYRRRLA